MSIYPSTFCFYNYNIPKPKSKKEMKLKTNLHLHTSDDPEDQITYSFIDVLDEAKKNGFGCMAITCHNMFIDNAEYKKAAEERGILFVPGVERTIEKRHVVILNPTADIKDVTSFEELRVYKKEHPEILIIAAHPYFPSGYSLREKLMGNKDLFDAIEHSWFYSRFINYNLIAKRVSELLNLPFIATSDTHDLRFLNTNYAEIEVSEKTIPALFEAIRNDRFTNVTSPRSLLGEMLPYTIKKMILPRGKR